MALINATWPRHKSEDDLTLERMSNKNDRLPSLSLANQTVDKNTNHVLS